MPRTSLELFGVKDALKLREEISRLEDLSSSNDRDWKRLPVFGAVLGTGSLGLGLLIGVPAAMIALAATVALGVISTFLIGGRRQQYADEIKDLKIELATLEGTGDATMASTESEAPRVRTSLVPAAATRQQAAMH
jgi:hypothetical protein